MNLGNLSYIPLIIRLFSDVIEKTFKLSLSGITEILPFTVLDVKGPILIGDNPGKKLTGKVKWDKPFLKQVTDVGMGVDIDILD